MMTFKSEKIGNATVVTVWVSGNDLVKRWTTYQSLCATLEGHGWLIRERVVHTGAMGVRAILFC